MTRFAGAVVDTALMSLLFAYAYSGEPADNQQSWREKVRGDCQFWYTVYFEPERYIRDLAEQKRGPRQTQTLDSATGLVADVITAPFAALQLLVRRFEGDEPIISVFVRTNGDNDGLKQAVPSVPDWIDHANLAFITLPLRRLKEIARLDGVTAIACEHAEAIKAEGLSAADRMDTPEHAVIDTINLHVRAECRGGDLTARAYIHLFRLSGKWALNPMTHRLALDYASMQGTASFPDIATGQYTLIMSCVCDDTTLIATKHIRLPLPEGDTVLIANSQPVR